MFFATYQSLKMQKFLAFQSTLQDKLVNWDCKKKSFQCQNKNKGLASLKRTNKLTFYESEEISRQLTGEKDCVSIRLPDKKKMKKEKQLILSSISGIYEQFTKENPDRKIGFSTFALLRSKLYMLVGAVGTHNVCVCTYHQNVKLLVAINSSHNYRYIMKMCVRTCCWQLWLYDGVLWWFPGSVSVKVIF